MTNRERQEHRRNGLHALVAPDAAALGACVTTARPDARRTEWLHHHQLAPFAVCRLRQTGALAGLPAGFDEALRDLYDNAAGPPVPGAAQIVNERFDISCSMNTIEAK
jgi:hypothetical protein